MQQKTDGRVVRLLTKHVSTEDRSLEQWFLVAIGDDDKAGRGGKGCQYGGCSC
jgi:hypothetical protein